MGRLAEAWDLATGLFADGFFSLVGAGCVLPALGVLLAYRRLPFATMAIPAAAGAGSAASYWLWPLLFEAAAHGTPHAPPFGFLLGGGAAGLVVCLAIIAGREGTTGSSESRAAIVFLAAGAVAELFLRASPYEEVAAPWLVNGRILSVLPEGRTRVLVACLAVAIGLRLLRRALLVTATDRDLAATAGYPERRWRFVTLALVSAASLAVVPELGPVVVLALLLIPASLGVPCAQTFRGAFIGASVCGGISTIVAFLAAVVGDLPVTPCLVVALVVVSAASRPLLQSRRPGRIARVT